MATISGENVKPGDRVYDVTQGYGTVIDTTFNNISVRFDSGIRVAFENKGFYSGVRRLYWHDPVVVEPPKNKSQWESLATCISSIKAYLSTL